MKKLRRTWQPTPAFLPGESSRTEEPGRLQSTGLQRVGHCWATKHSTAQGDNTYLHKIPGSSGSHHCHCKENAGPVIPSSSPDHSSGESWTWPSFRGLPSLRGIPGKQWEKRQGPDFWLLAPAGPREPHSTGATTLEASEASGEQQRARRAPGAVPRGPAVLLEMKLLSAHS